MRPLRSNADSDACADADADRRPRHQLADMGPKAHSRAFNEWCGLCFTLFCSAPQLFLNPDPRAFLLLLQTLCPSPLVQLTIAVPIPALSITIPVPTYWRS
jgi:hypothetical protein